MIINFWIIISYGNLLNTYFVRLFLLDVLFQFAVPIESHKLFLIDTHRIADMKLCSPSSPSPKSHRGQPAKKNLMNMRCSLSFYNFLQRDCDNLISRKDYKEANRKFRSVVVYWPNKNVTIYNNFVSMTERKRNKVSREKFRPKLLTILFWSLSSCREVRRAWKNSKEFFLSFTFPSWAHKQFLSNSVKR